MIVNDNKINISFDVLYYAYNILAAYTVLKLLNIDEKNIATFISDEQNKKLNTSFSYKNRKVYVLNSKNEIIIKIIEK